MALIHQLALRADNGLFHIAKEKEKQIEREAGRFWGATIYEDPPVRWGHWWSLIEDEVFKWCGSA